jgi:hypothetical protein
VGQTCTKVPISEVYSLRDNILGDNILSVSINILNYSYYLGFTTKHMPMRDISRRSHSIYYIWQ